MSVVVGGRGRGSEVRRRPEGTRPRETGSGTKGGKAQGGGSHGGGGVTLPLRGQEQCLETFLVVTTG